MNVIIEQYGTIFIILACAFGLFMAWGVGANDVANAMGTSVGSKALTIRQAIIIAIVFELAGAVLAGGEVTSTIRKDIVDLSAFSEQPQLLIYGMLASLLAAGIWLLVATRFGWPVSTTHSIVGAIVGFAAVGIGIDSVRWDKVGEIALSWITSPIIAGIIAFGLFKSIQNLILNTATPFKNAKRYVPYYVFLVGFVISMVTLIKGLKHVGMEINHFTSLQYSIGIGLILMLVGKFLIRNVQPDKAADRKFHFSSVEVIFGVLTLFTACAMAFAHGSNDVANAVAPLAAVYSVASTGSIEALAIMPSWILLLGGLGIVLGLTTYGYKVIATVGTGITELTPSRGFAATLAAATTVVFASSAGFPVSTTHTLVGAILGVGLARGIGALNLSVIRMIFMSWIITLPVGGVLSIFFFFFLKGLFG